MKVEMLNVLDKKGLSSTKEILITIKIENSETITSDLQLSEVDQSYMKTKQKKNNKNK